LGCDISGNDGYKEMFKSKNENENTPLPVMKSYCGGG